jgi:hypothetical protein
MKNEIVPPDCLNASEFMWRVIASTPAKLQKIKGVVNVAARLRIDAAGAVTITSVCCETLTGRPVAEDDPEIIAAARSALSVLRFAPARKDGAAVVFEDFDLSFGFTTAALAHTCTGRDRLRSQALKN